MQNSISKVHYGRCPDFYELWNLQCKPIQQGTYLTNSEPSKEPIDYLNNQFI